MTKQKRKINAKKLWLIVILISIILVPAFYGFTYLKSYWNNSVTINKVPIAVVNLDQSYTKDGKTYDIGNTLITNLKGNNSLDWKFVNYNQAKEGVYGDKYFAMIVIPKDFSEKIANATTDGFKKPKIDFYQNQGKNYIFSEISGIGVDQVVQTISESISKSVSNVLVQTIYKSKDGFKTAADGSSKLVNGINKLSDGSKSLVSGMGKLLDGSQSLSTGVSKLSSGSNTLESGIDKLYGGSNTLIDGVSKLSDGSKSLVSGATKLQGGSSSLVNGVSKLENGSNSLVSGINSLSSGSKTLNSGAKQLASASSSLASGMNSLHSGASQIQEGQAGISKEMAVLKELIASGNTQKASALLNQMSEQNAKLEAGMSSLSSGIKKANSGAMEISGGANNLSGGLSKLNSGINSAKAGANQLNGGLASAKNGAIALNSGISELSNGAKALNGGLSQVSTGASALNNGLNSARGGVSELSNGLKSVGSGVGTLNSAISSAKTGASTLSTGLVSANTGATDLNNGLESGYKNLNDNVTFTAAQMSDFIANPVILNTIAINPVASYGEGFAPYFMGIALFVGAMYAYYMVSALSRKFEGSFTRRFIKMYIIGAILCILQALVMSAIIYYGLGVHTSTPLWFFGVNIITTIALFSLMNGLHYIITPIMKGALVVIMVLQFTACGGSYPVQVMPAFYNMIHPFLILSYGVDTMRMAISGINYSIFYKDLGILVLFIVGSLIIGYAVGYIKTHITHKRVLKERSELIEEKEAYNQYV